MHACLHIYNMHNNGQLFTKKLAVCNCTKNVLIYYDELNSFFCSFLSISISTNSKQIKIRRHSAFDKRDDNDNLLLAIQLVQYIFLIGCTCKKLLCQGFNIQCVPGLTKEVQMTKKLNFNFIFWV